MFQKVLFCFEQKKDLESSCQVNTWSQIGNLEQIEGLIDLLKELEKQEIPVQIMTWQQRKIISKDCFFITDQEEAACAAKQAGAVCIGYLSEEKISSFQTLDSADVLVEGFEEVDLKFLEEIWCHEKGEPYLATEGKRIYLKELVPEEALTLYQIYHQPAVLEFVPEVAKSPEEERHRLEAYQQYAYRFYGYGLWGIYRKTDDCLMGCCGLELKEWKDGNIRLELGYVLDPVFWGYGYATEAAALALAYGKRLGFESIWAKIETNNQRSRFVAKRVGMKPIETRNENGKEYMVYMFSVG